MTGVWQVTKKHAPYTKDSIFALGSPPHTRRYALAQSKLLATDLSKSILLTAQGAVQQNNAYSPYGELRPGCARNLLAYNGEYLEQAGLYLLGHGNRVYSPRLMRFLSPDRIGVFLQRNYNAYAYCNGDPINYSDPSGNVGTLKQLAQKSLISHGDNPVAAAEITRQRFNARLIETGKLLKEFKSTIESKNQLTEILSISTQYQDKKIDTATAEQSLHKLLPFTLEGGAAHKKILNLSREEIKTYTKTTEQKAFKAEKLRREIAVHIPLLEAELIAYFDALSTVKAAMSAMNRQHWQSADKNLRIRQ
ncbi:RHS repeat-associated core domain-containing protein [Pseudomonas sp. B21-023]|uniref:RHS repeat-associated core domain-containing protein n=1 Tax=unclassified Pseudomonas TaxID=196821 RepID=UPI0015ADAC7F|nr:MULTISPECIES: RHS repeat-associated core domain-containing protein [unclassified Pseudomonas]UVL19771.1 RHS repeat-associated core domain-containing protein [Pseudomonas sp. B21-044]UVM17155.1 RHS repeat-associated core domain-containing protein [Pseudomonas sp. B21-023]